MNIFKRIYCRTYQKVFYIALPFMPYRNPSVKKHLSAVPSILKKEGAKKPLIVTDRNLAGLDYFTKLKKCLIIKGFDYEVFDGALPNPTISLAKTAYEAYKSKGCDSIIALGGGSPMDLAKAVGIMEARPGVPLNKLRGILKVRKKLPLIIAIPTTAGSGSEATLAAVLTDDSTRHKFAIIDFPLIPRYAVLDRETISTVPLMTAVTTGLDALTHAIEVYIGRSVTASTRHASEKAVYLIFRNLKEAAEHSSENAETAMLVAAHYAGRAFTRSYVGYIHALSHALSGAYNLPHGWTNAVILPIVLRRYGSAVEKKLAKLAVCAGLGSKDEESHVLCERFISAIEDINHRYGLPDHIEAIKAEDISRLAAHADKEANPLYPVPVLWDKKELEKIYRDIM